MAEPKPYFVEVTDDDPTLFGVGFNDEETPLTEERRIDILADLLNREPSIERAYREDRESLNIEAREGMDLATIESAVDRAWVEAGGLVEPIGSRTSTSIDEV
jgi:hypothetical protein